MSALEEIKIEYHKLQNVYDKAVNAGMDRGTLIEIQGWLVAAEDAMYDIWVGESMDDIESLCSEIESMEME